MNYIKRAFLSLAYRWRSSLLLVIIFAVIATLILSGLCIKSASEQSCAAVRREIGGSVSLSSTDSDDSSRYQSIPYDSLKKIAALPHVKSYILRELAFAHADNFMYVPDAGADPSKIEQDVAFWGVTSTALLSDFSDGSYKISSGRAISAADEGKAVAMINKSLADLNKLKVGDSISVALKKGSDKKVTLQVIGIYESTKPPVAGASEPQFMDENCIYTAFGQVGKLTGVEKGSMATFYMDDPINIDSFKAEAAALKLPNFSDYTLDASDAVYQQMAGPLNSLTTIATVMVYGIIIAGAIILSLIVILSLRGRQYEIGVLLSMGERRVKVMVQMALEILIPVLVAFTLSIAAGNIAASQIGGIMYSGQTQAQVSDGSTQASSDNGTITDSKTGKTYKMPQKIDVGVRPDNLLELYLAGIALALVSAAAPVVVVTRFNPKDILTKIE